VVQWQGMIAEYERAQIAERSRRGKRHKAQQGVVNVLSAAPLRLPLREEERRLGGLLPSGGSGSSMLKEMVGTRRLEPFHAGTYLAT